MNTYQGEKANDDAYDTGTTAVERKDRGICLTNQWRRETRLP